jgi:hypothetical protein
MPRYRYDKDTGELYEIRDRSNYFEESKGPTVIKDIDGYRAIGADVALDGGRPWIGSRSEHRAYLRRNGYVETGNETPRVYDDRPTARQMQESRVHDIKRAMGEYGSNTRRRG